jgi:hypothetical protein
MFWKASELAKIDRAETNLFAPFRFVAGTIVRKTFALASEEIVLDRIPVCSAG